MRAIAAYAEPRSKSVPQRIIILPNTHVHNANVFVISKTLSTPFEFDVVFMSNPGRDVVSEGILILT